MATSPVDYVVGNLGISLADDGRLSAACDRGKWLATTVPLATCCKNPTAAVEWVGRVSCGQSSRFARPSTRPAGRKYPISIQQHRTKGKHNEKNDVKNTRSSLDKGQRQLAHQEAAFDAGLSRQGTRRHDDLSVRTIAKYNVRRCTTRWATKRHYLTRPAARLHLDYSHACHFIFFPCFSWPYLIHYRGKRPKVKK